MVAPLGYLLDTNILVALIRGNKLGQYIDRRYVLRASMAQCVISAITIGEMLSLTRKFRWGIDKVDNLYRLLEELVVVDINHPDIYAAYADIDHATDSTGLGMGKNDLWIAATSRATGLTLLTTDTDFDRLVPDWITRVWVDEAYGR